MRGYQREGVVDAIRAAGGEIYAITSEPQSLATNAREDWETGFEHVGDPHHEILEACRRRGWLPLFTHSWKSEFLASEKTWMSHPKGYFQPGVLALDGRGRVLYRWRSRPSRRNVGGAVARPSEKHVWARVRAALEAPGDAPDAPHDDAPVLGDRPVPWALFVTLLLANGWFLRPVAFDQRPGENTVWRRQRNAMLRVPLFLGLWIGAFALLPFWLAAPALAGWGALVAVGVRRVNESFQDVGPEPGAPDADRVRR